MRQFVALALLLALLHARAVWGHGDVLPFIAFWNHTTMPFNSKVVFCQRMIGQTWQQCMARAMRVDQRCASKQLAGESCDSAADNAAIASFQSNTDDQIAAACSDDDARALYFL